MGGKPACALGTAFYSEAVKANGSGLLILMVTSLSASLIDFLSVFQHWKLVFIKLTFRSNRKWKMLKEIIASMVFVIFYSPLFITPHL